MTLRNRRCSNVLYRKGNNSAIMDKIHRMQEYTCTAQLIRPRGKQLPKIDTQLRFSLKNW